MSFLNIVSFLIELSEVIIDMISYKEIFYYQVFIHSFHKYLLYSRL